MRFWIGVASLDHVQRGVAGGFCQLCHGKSQPLRRMSVGDWIVYYSPKMVFGQVQACQQFTAIGEVTGADAYEFKMASDFIPYRRDIQFYDSHSVAIHPLLGFLSFIKNAKLWGQAFRYGHFAISQPDFALIAERMLGTVPMPRAECLNWLK